MTTEMSAKHEATRLTNSTYDIIRALEKDADFLYSTVDRYIDDASKENRSDLIGVWNTIKQDKERHVQLLREALAKEAKEERLK
ncbi:hypothetical protein NTE_00135 [Candidatus Nitrososphaera evergladensis SR1]|jgi:hypothetical protein|uniref:Rubrerythrin n=1 Tax=Candidatus Nitrososphaera evergladensis SR1 TaxID=1459636 RepID=A0A075MN55_9ARCH|nr:hypothetical protein [Candidatus Nitrososphaera evergladensis]AIF82217.1 hypothetical protein NTE_00135 [Candidatus Nitrososphaera evergladensis SR1]